MRSSYEEVAKTQTKEIKISDLEENFIESSKIKDIKPLAREGTHGREIYWAQIDGFWVVSQLEN